MFRLPRPLKRPVTVAVLDCGTNTVLLLVARLQLNGKITALRQALVSPRLGEGLIGKGKLRSKAKVRTFRALKKLKREALHFKPDICLALGTNVFRRARDGRRTARHFEKKLGFPFVVLSAVEEARLEFRGALSGLKVNPKIIVIDVGGGSSEIIWGKNGKSTHQTSLEIGAVRLKEKFPALKNIDSAAQPKLEATVAKATSKLKPKPGHPLAVLTGGTATTLAAFSLGLDKYQSQRVHGFKTTPQNLKNQLEKLSRLSPAERKKALSFEPARADIILPGGLILLEILTQLKVEKLIVSDHGLRWGAIHAYFS